MRCTDMPRLQPHDLEAEQAVLGAILQDAAALSSAQAILRPEHFYDSRHQHIFAAMLDLADHSEPVDLVTLGDLLESRSELGHIGGRGVLAELLTVVASSTNIAHHSKIVLAHAQRRRLIRLCFDVTEGAYAHKSVDRLLRDAERALLEIALGEHDRECCSMATVCKETAEYVDAVYKRGTAVIGIPTGFAALDSMLGGWQRGDLVIIAARPSMGKTAFALSSALAAADMGHRVCLLSIEMSIRQIGLRLHGMEAPMDVHTLKTGRLNPDGWRRFANATQKLEGLPLWVDDSSDLTVEQVAAKARALKASPGLDVLIVDYLQLLQTADMETRQQGIADASRKLKLLAKELDIPVLVLSQLSRACENRDNRRPMLADLRDSGAIEQDADVVLFLYRHEWYVPNTDEKGVAELLVRKHRNGPTGDRRLKFVDQFARFEDFDSE
jgi:replicative DNA helicase